MFWRSSPQTVGVRLRAVRLVVFLFTLFTARAPAFFLGPTSHLVPFLVIPLVDGGMLGFQVIPSCLLKNTSPAGPKRNLHPRIGPAGKSIFLYTYIMILGTVSSINRPGTIVLCSICLRPRGARRLLQIVHLAAAMAAVDFRGADTSYFVRTIPWAPVFPE
jgi:hypothetical protein